MGYDAAKKIKGRKIHPLVDVEGLPLRVIVHSAGIQDRDGAGLVLDKIRESFPGLELVWADGGYNAHQVQTAAAANPGLRVEIVKRSDDMKGFVVLPRRWVVERTFSWFGRNRRLAKDYENLAQTLTAFVSLAAIQLGIRRTRAEVAFSQVLSLRHRTRPPIVFRRQYGATAYRHGSSAARRHPWCQSLPPAPGRRSAGSTV